MKSFMVIGVTKSGRDMKFPVRAKNIEQAEMVAGVYFEFFSVVGGVK